MIEQALSVLTNGRWWDYLDDSIPCDVEEELCGAIEAVEALARGEQKPNEPLTLEALREMDGEPVWVKDLERPGQTAVCRVLKCFGSHTGVICWTDGHGDMQEDCGITWLAYRRKPEGSTK